jgi:hypothetical protein
VVAPTASQPRTGAVENLALDRPVFISAKRQAPLRIFEKLELLVQQSTQPQPPIICALSHVRDVEWSGLMENPLHGFL